MSRLHVHNNPGLATRRSSVSLAYYISLTSLAHLRIAPSMFGRDLTEQVHADAALGGDRQVPVIVEKCIDAVEELGEIPSLAGIDYRI